MSLSVALRHRLGAFALDAAFEAPEGITVLFGRSGSGKSTIVRAIAGLLAPGEGRISLGERVLLDTAAGVALPPHRRRIGSIFQDGRLFPHMTVRDNLLYGQRLAPRAARRTDPERIVAMLGIGGLMDRRPRHLSGGEVQRVAIGRALLSEPELVLADEPLAALDAARKAEILPYFERLRDELKVPMVYVSHDAAEVARLATTVVALEAGRVVAQGPALEVLGDPEVTPAGAEAAGAVLEAVVVAHHADGITELRAGGAALYLPLLARPVGALLRVRIAAQEVILAREAPGETSALNVLSGTVVQVREGGGPGALVLVETAAGRVLARVTRRSVARLGLAPGVACHAIVKSVAIARGDVGG